MLKFYKLKQHHFIFEAGSQYVAHSELGLELKILLPQLPSAECTTTQGTI
jgi:hypothetical protein